jgi:hypothetical protein
VGIVRLARAEIGAHAAQGTGVSEATGVPAIGALAAKEAVTGVPMDLPKSTSTNLLATASIWITRRMSS